MDVFLNTIVEVPVWFPVVATLSGGIVGVLSLFVSLVVLGKIREPISKTKPKSVAQNTEPTVPVDSELVKQEPEPVPVPQTQVSVNRAGHGVPPIRQHYWYYVSGVPGRFPALKDALVASGVPASSANRLPDWGKLSSGVRSKIKRVKVGEEQPVLAPVVARKEIVRDESVPAVKRGDKREPRDGEESESIVRKPIGDGAFVTTKRGKKRKSK